MSHVLGETPCDPAAALQEGREPTSTKGWGLPGPGSRRLEFKPKFPDHAPWTITDTYAPAEGLSRRCRGGGCTVQEADRNSQTPSFVKGPLSFNRTQAWQSGPRPPTQPAAGSSPVRPTTAHPDAVLHGQKHQVHTQKITGGYSERQRAGGRAWPLSPAVPPNPEHCIRPQK